jgi:hypothetical protein
MEILRKRGLINTNTLQTLAGFTIYPSEYFAPKSIVDGKLRMTDNTYSIHHYGASWVSQHEKIYYETKRRLCSVFGETLGIVISFPYFILVIIKNNGLNKGLKIIKNKILLKK